MKKNKIDYSEVVISRIMIMMFAIAFLCFLAWLYVVPFKKNYLQINDYYKYIEYVTIAVTFILSVCGYVYASVAKRKSKDFSMSVVTPSMINILLTSTFFGALIIPFSNNRAIFSKNVILFYIGIFIAYLTYYTVNKQFAFQTVICTSFCVILRVFEGYYPSSITFNDNLSLSHTNALLIVIGFTLLIALISFIRYKKVNGFKLWQSITLCLIMLVSLIVRMFYLKYVNIVTTFVLLFALLIFVVIEKLVKRK